MFIRDSSYSTQSFCDNNVVNLLLSHFVELAENKGIEFDIKTQLPETIPFDDFNICGLLSNALENAINATSKVPDTTQKVIAVSILVKQHNLLISIENPYIGSIKMTDGIPISKRENHGFGTKSIASIVSSYNGQVSYTIDGSIFRARIMLPFE